MTGLADKTLTGANTANYPTQQLSKRGLELLSEVIEPAVQAISRTEKAVSIVVAGDQELFYPALIESDKLAKLFNELIASKPAEIGTAEVAGQGRTTQLVHAYQKAQEANDFLGGVTTILAKSEATIGEVASHNKGRNNNAGKSNQSLGA